MVIRIARSPHSLPCGSWFANACETLVLYLLYPFFRHHVHDVDDDDDDDDDVLPSLLSLPLAPCKSCKSSVAIGSCCYMLPLLLAPDKLGAVGVLKKDGSPLEALEPVRISRLTVQ